ncbi:hypothetical protein DFW101_3151 [Solidesulfovibrio carbinoliphilus subsp. oakridgensis]|uniref:AB hydrolase-1 domain-containing protein n=1 Tax=Solidesulfovibrio carbinoliphilus subsp. oakridgensis TaxID=694327 RepID=G7Q8R4_9BACT|nr:alpha/beta fold hydrolase [Solidesulfovibrio carbinoliphilus]EHJ49151.1 hypothetical protein DFW101_3151 [Solidesulfovibrio carbinoliphilus subsp. oakridgensis]
MLFRNACKPLPGHCLAARRLPAGAVLLGFVLLALAGCARIGVRPVPIDTRANALERTALNSDRPSERTLAFLAQRDLEGAWRGDAETMLLGLDREARVEHSREAVFVLAELCYFEAARNKGDPDRAALFHLSSAVYAYQYLFNTRLSEAPGVYQPYARQAMDFYNRSLAYYILYARQTGLAYAPGKELPWLRGKVRLAGRVSELAFSPAELESYHVAYEFEVAGLSPQQVRLGLGVPLALVRKPPPVEERRAIDRFTPRVRQTYAATAFLRLGIEPLPDTGPRVVYEAELEVHDPMREDTLAVGDRRMPLEIDLTTPLAFMMQQSPEPNGLQGMLDPAAWDKLSGLYMLQPYDPEKIPVVFVHGLMSTPATWATVFNGLMGDPELRARYQFWYFRYPTGNPVLYSAAMLRAALDEVRHTFDPNGTNPRFNAMVVVSHSMGGLLAKTLAEDSGTALWDAVSKTPLASLSLSAEDRAAVEKIFFFTHRPYVARMVFVAVPHRGSELALTTIGRIGRALITLPLTVLRPVTAVTAALAAAMGHDKKDAARAALPVPTGVDSLSPNSPILRVLASLPLAVPFHSIIGNEKAADTPGGTDGVVAYASSHLDGAVSEKIVRSGHSAQDHPLAIREMRRILLLHLGETVAPSPGS